MSRRYPVFELDVSCHRYPGLLREIPDPPRKLYCRGTLDLEGVESCLAVVGSRKMSPYGKKAVSHIFRSLHSSIAIVSGFMFGVDAEAHRAALKGGLYTVAVMPCGIDVIHPQSQVDLYEEILARGGLIISEYEGDFAPRAWTYPKRNRIVAGMSKAVLVVEAETKSGSLITADLENDFERPVFAVPGSIFSSTSRGCLELLKSYGCLAKGGEDINEFFGFSPFLNSETDNDRGVDPLAQKILSILKCEGMTIDQLSVEVGLPSEKLGVKITLMTIEGLVKEIGGFVHVS
jgi:DNA processing protein